MGKDKKKMEEQQQMTLEDEGEQRKQQKEGERNQEGEQEEHPWTQNPQLSEHCQRPREGMRRKHPPSYIRTV